MSILNAAIGAGVGSLFGSATGTKAITAAIGAAAGASFVGDTAERVVSFQARKLTSKAEQKMLSGLGDDDDYDIDDASVYAASTLSRKQLAAASKEALKLNRQVKVRCLPGKKLVRGVCRRKRSR